MKLHQERNNSQGLQGIQWDLQNYFRYLKPLIKDSNAMRRHGMDNSFYYNYEVDDAGSITFSTAFLPNEKADSFLWLFETFLKAMGEHKPIVIITYQNPTTKIAIEKIFNGYTHRFCMWHILEKNSKRVGVFLNIDTNFNCRVKSCILNSETPEEFELTWKNIIEDFKLEEN
ncbi:hypothetical protein Lal_00041574 [Lupinus albus]|nr:hypothetical protein Lal_00041574 [Lupinus albus]